MAFGLVEFEIPKPLLNSAGEFNVCASEIDDCLTAYTT